MTRYRIHKARTHFFPRRVDRLSGISLMRLRRSSKQLYLEITSKSVPTAVQGFHRVRRGLHGGLEATITLSLRNTISPEGLYIIGNTHDLLLLSIVDYWKRSRRITQMARLSVWLRIWRWTTLLVLSPILIYYYLWREWRS